MQRICSLHVVLVKCYFVVKYQLDDVISLFKDKSVGSTIDATV